MGNDGYFRGAGGLLLSITLSVSSQLSNLFDAQTKPQLPKNVLLMGLHGKFEQAMVGEFVDG